MKIKGLIWLRNIVNKLSSKHNIETNEVEKILESKPKFKFIEPLDDLVEFFDSQDLGDFWEDLLEAKFDVDIKSKKHLSI